MLDRLRDEKLKKRHPGVIGEEIFFKTAVLLPLVHNEAGELCVLLEKRALTLRRQAGEICFPGGHIDAGDKNPQEAAIRECCEELGLAPQDIEYLFPLDLLITPFNLKLHPYVGYIYDLHKVVPSPAEVDRILLVPLQWLLTHPPLQHYVPVNMHPGEDYPYHLIPGGRDYPWFPGRYPHLFYEWEDEIIWGLTARVLHNFLQLIGAQEE
ncbi:MAG: CoA pyrophosphatase [Syntrophomonadaceae bacterium]|nr:CoA pyrophosphatase [Syntrophomonadaceae bacterium]